MQPVKITIYGDYIDCQIYRGRLYLWTFDGGVKIYKWNELVQSLSKKQTNLLTLRFCFQDGNYLYKSNLIELFNDTDFKSLLLKKFSIVAKRNYELTVKQADKFLFGEQDTPTKIIPTDTEIYNNSLYFITENGLFSSTANRKESKYPISSKPKKLWDCNLLSLKANKYPQLALSGGNEGLFELNISRDDRWDKKDPARISSLHSSFANYTYWSIYNSSVVDNSYMALFRMTKNIEVDNSFGFENKQTTYKREYETLISENNIFGGNQQQQHLSWGVEDKIYRATDGGFEIVKFNNRPRADQGETYFTPLKNIDLYAWKGKVTGGSTSYFGTIVECENALVVMLSNEKSFTITGPITRWRIYPRSRNYQNHLHVIKDDRIEIYSFNQDYFLEQEDKLLGIEYKSNDFGSVYNYI